jgi:hypothetical protein
VRQHQTFLSSLLLILSEGISCRDVRAVEIDLNWKTRNLSEFNEFDLFRKTLNFRISIRDLLIDGRWPLHDSMFNMSSDLRLHLVDRKQMWRRTLFHLIAPQRSKPNRIFPRNSSLLPFTCTPLKVFLLQEIITRNSIQNHFT